MSAIPFIAGTVAMVWNGSHSDKTGEARLHCAFAALIAAVGLAATGALIGNGIGGADRPDGRGRRHPGGFPGLLGHAQTFLTGTAAAGGIAVINSIGNLAGFVAPYTIGLSTVHRLLDLRPLRRGGI